MDSTWKSGFRERLRSFEDAGKTGEASASIKIRVTSGCFHREHSPHAYVLIDERLRSSRPSNLAFVEHESGPELLIFVGAVASAFQLAGSVIDLVTAIFQARHDGVESGDVPAEPLELIVRRFDEAGTLREETILRVAKDDPVNRALVGDSLRTALERVTSEQDIRG